MYRINVLDGGKYNNVKLGFRYCITKKSAKSLIDTFSNSDCNFTVEKFIRIHQDIFAWTDDDEKDKVFDYYFDKTEN